MLSATPGQALPALTSIWLAVKFLGIVVAANLVALMLLIVPGINIAAFFLVNGGIALALARLPTMDAWTTYNGLVAYLLMGTMFGVEYSVRKYRFGRLGTHALDRLLVVREFAGNWVQVRTDDGKTGYVDRNYLIHLIEKAESVIHRKIRYLVYETEEFERMDMKAFSPQPLLLWSKE